MDPYEANISNGARRIGAWLRGMLRRHRRQLLALTAAGVTLAIGVSAAKAPAPAEIATAATGVAPR